MKKVPVFILFSIFVSSFPALGQLTNVEKKIVKTIDHYNDDAIYFLKKVVNINSGTMNFEGVKEVGMEFQEKFEDLGLETQWVDGSEWGRAGHLIATHEGDSDKPKLLLIGHLDTVFELDSPFQTFTMLNDSTMRGPGVADMKGGNVIIVEAIRALKEANLLKNMNIRVILIGDEESSGDPLDLAKKDLVEAAEWADIALGFENGDGNPKTIVVARRGSQGWELKVNGVQAHSSQVFTDRVGAGAIYETSRILMGFYEELKSEEILTYNPGLILGGTAITYDQKDSRGTAFGKSNVVAKEVLVKGDLRSIDPEQLERVMSKMKEITGESLPQTTAELTFRKGGYPPLPPSDGNYKLLELYSQISQELGYGKVDPVNPRDAGAADISFTAGLVDMAIDGMGLSGSAGHSTEETGDLHMLPVQAKRAAILMYRLSYRD